MDIDRKYIDEHDMIPRYARDELAGEELEAFEVYFLEHPEILDEIEVERSLRRGLSGASDALRAPASAGGLLGTLTRWFQQPALAGGARHAQRHFRFLVLNMQSIQCRAHPKISMESATSLVNTLMRHAPVNQLIRLTFY